jgi:hypothetical protein
MSIKLPRNVGHYFSVDEILFIENEILEIAEDNPTKAYLKEAFGTARKGDMQKGRLNRIVARCIGLSVKNKFDMTSGDVLGELYNRKEWYKDNKIGENEYENQIRNTIDWR